MAYIHQRSLQRARSNLYKLGKSDRPRQRVEDAAAGMMGSLFPGAPAKMTEEQKREEMKRAIFQGAYQQQMDQRNAESTKSLLDRERSFSSNNNLAEKSMIGGQYTMSGLDNAAKDAELNAQDRLMMKSFLYNQLPLGMGGTPTPFLAPQVGNF